MKFKKILFFVFFNIFYLSFSNDIIIDTEKSKNLSLDKTANGIPLINIESPNSNGLSHNIFKEYNVSQKGVILNNALYFETTKLGGIVYGNPNLQNSNKQAQTILNEISGTNKTRLEGFTEIAGKQADYILANPNGIYINGAGFINTKNVTLTTGNIHNLTNPEKGIIEIADKGIDLRNINKSELIAKTALFTAPIYAGDELNIKLGNKNLENKTEATLDAILLGSMYAGRINIISNEEGVGVKSNSIISAQNDDLIINSKGKVELKEIEAKKNIKILSKEFDLEEKALAEENINIKADKIINKGNILGNNNLKLEGMLENSGNIYSENEIELIADEINLSENILAKNNINLKTNNLNIQDRYITESNVNATINGDYINSSEFISKNLNIKANKIINMSILGAKNDILINADLENNENSLLYSKNNMNLNGENLENRGNIYSGKDLNIRYTSNIKNLTSEIEAKGNANIETKNLENKGHITGSHTLKWVSGSKSNIDTTKLPIDFLEDIDRLLNRNRRGKKFRGWDEEKRLNMAQQGVSNYISHKSYLKIGGNLNIIANHILNQEADIVVNKELNIDADNFFNTREAKEIDIILQFSRKYHYRHKRKNGSNTTKHGHIYASKVFKDTLYSDKATNLIVGGNINANIKILGNGEKLSATQDIDKNSPTSFNVINNINTLLGLDLRKYNNSNGIFYIVKNDEKPKFSYLIETNPRFTDKSMYLGSEYFFSRIKFNPDKDIRLLGDSYFETKLINKTVLETTGKRYLFSEDTNIERKILFDNAIQAQKDLNLSLGINLTKEQINNLESDILWYIEEEIDGEKILVPKIFLSKKTLKNINERGNSIIADGNININALFIENNGNIIANKNINIRAKDFSQKALYAENNLKGENLSIITANKFVNIGGNINAKKNINISAQEILNKKNLRIHENDYYNIFTDTLGEAKISGENIEINSNNFKNLGVDITANDKIKINTKENLTIENLEIIEQKISSSKKKFVLDRKTKNVESNLKAKDIELNSLENLNIIGSNLNAKDKIDISAKEDINIVAGKNSTLHEEKHKKSKSFGRSSSNTDILYNEEILASELKAKDISHKNANIIGGNILAINNLNVLANNDINIVAAQKGFSEIHQSTKSGLFKLSGKVKMEDNLKYTNVESIIEAENNINLISNKNINLIASKLISGKDTNIRAKENVNILAADDKFKSDKKESKYSIKPFASAKGLKFEVGLKGNYAKRNESNFSTKVKGSEIFSGNNINIESNSDTNIQASTIISENTNIDTKGNLNLLTKEEISINNTSGTEIEAKLNAKLDLTGIKNTVKSVVDVVKGLPNLPKAANVALKLASGKDINESLAGNEEGIEEVSRILNGPSSGGVSAGIYASVSLEKMKSKTEIKNSVGSNILSKENISLSSDENIKLKQASIQGKNISINSKKDISIESGISTVNSKASSQSLNGEINLLSGEFNVDGGISKDKSDEKIHTNSEIFGENVMINSEVLSIKGGNIQANKIEIKAKNLHLESMQDKANSKHQAINISVGKSSIGGGMEYGKNKKEWVSNQSSIIGREKSEIEVAEKTNIIGALIGGADTTLKTKELKYSNIEDKEKGFNVGMNANLNINSINVYNENEPDNPHKKTKVSKAGNANYSAVDREQINRATIGAGKIIIDGKEENPDINRDESKAQEIMRDISVKKIKVAYTDNARKWSELPRVIGEQGASLGKGLESIIALTSSNNYNLEKKLESAFYKTYKKGEEFLDYKLGNKHIGIIPTEDTNGGIAGGLLSSTVLLSRNLTLIKTKYYGKVNENGEFNMKADVKKLTQADYEKTNDKSLYLNGVGNTLKDHIEGRFSGTLTPEEHERIRNGEIVEKISIFNPTSGLIIDSLKAIIGEIGLMTGFNWNGKQLSEIEKKYQGIFKDGIDAHSLGTIIYLSKLRDDLKTKEGREKISKMGKSHLLGIATLSWITEDTLEKVNALNEERILLEVRRNPKDFVSFGTLNLKSNTNGKGHGVAGYNPYYYKWNSDEGKYILERKLPKINGDIIIINKGDKHDGY